MGGALSIRSKLAGENWGKNRQKRTDTMEPLGAFNWLNNWTLEKSRGEPPETAESWPGGSSFAKSERM